MVVDTCLVIAWSYDHTGGLHITSTLVEYYDHSINKMFQLPPSCMSGSGSAAESSGSGELLLSGTSASIPLPMAGLTYTFRVTATNDVGSATATCPSIFLTTGYQILFDISCLYLP